MRLQGLAFELAPPHSRDRHVEPHKTPKGKNQWQRQGTHVHMKTRLHARKARTYEDTTTKCKEKETAATERALSPRIHNGHRQRQREESYLSTLCRRNCSTPIQLPTRARTRARASRKFHRLCAHACQGLSTGRPPLGSHKRTAHSPSSQTPCAHVHPTKAAPAPFPSPALVHLAWIDLTDEHCPLAAKPAAVPWAVPRLRHPAKPFS